LRLVGQKRQTVQYVVGHPLLAVEMTRHAAGSALYAPLRALIYEAGRVSSSTSQPGIRPKLPAWNKLRPRLDNAPGDGTVFAFPFPTKSRDGNHVGEPAGPQFQAEPME
jgi:hypothetical protein